MARARDSKRVPTHSPLRSLFAPLSQSLSSHLGRQPLFMISLSPLPLTSSSPAAPRPAGLTHGAPEVVCFEGEEGATLSKISRTEGTLYQFVKSRPLRTSGMT